MPQLFSFLVLFLMQSISFKTKGRLDIQATILPLEIDHALSKVSSRIDTRKGAILSSGFDYPGRHSRWDIGFIDPALELISSGRNFCLNALNQKGAVLLKILKPKLVANKHLTEIILSEKVSTSSVSELHGEIVESSEFFTEEQRSRQPSIFSLIRTLVDILKTEEPIGSHLGLYGAFGYDLIFNFENIKQNLKRDSQNPDCHLFLPLELIIVDRKKETAEQVSFEISDDNHNTNDFQSGGYDFPASQPKGDSTIVCDHQPGEFAKKVAKVIEGTKRGDYFEVVLSQTFSARFDRKPTDLFNRLTNLNPSPYLFLINLGEEQLIGSSPEIYVRITGNRFETCPIAGTVSRGADALEDADRIKQLIVSKKEESELTMCTDVDRNDMARVCVPGSVKIIGRRQIELYSHLIHTVDHLEGEIADNYDSIDAFQSHMWACTVTGAPKPAALQEIENLESTPRGWYSGAIGYIGFNGNINTGITLRTASLKNGRAHLRAGATLLFESNPTEEEQETRTKAAAFLSALTNQSSPQKTGDEKYSASSLLNKAGKNKKILLVDYRDSFVHNLASYLRTLDAEVVTLRPNFSEKILKDINPDLVFLSPGPGAPSDFGIPEFVGKLVELEFPIFGVCLGHQAIGLHFGAELKQLSTPQHGKTAVIRHAQHKIFENIETEFEAGRYHSLYLEKDTMPDCLEIIAETVIDSLLPNSKPVVMAVAHREHKIASVQFHPESLMTLKKNVGYQLLNNVVKNLTN
jgi:anthranilate synthase